MFTWISDSISSIIIGVLLIAAVAAIIVHMIRNHKRGKTSCGCGCRNCSMKNSCRK